MVRWRFGLVVAASVVLMRAQSGAAPSERLLAPYGLDKFSPLYRQSVDALFTAWPAYQRGEYGRASQILDAFWKLHPAGSKEWQAAQGEGERVARTIGVEYSDPPCYAALRMLTECVAWRLATTPARTSGPPLRFTVILIGHSHGIQPSTVQELHEQRGAMVRNTLDAHFREAPEAIVEDCFGLLFEYIRAITDGRLPVKTRILQYPELDVPMRVFDNPGQPRAELAPGAEEQIWNAIDPEVKASTDWWYILYPSHRPEQYPGFAHTDFSNGGGISMTPDSGAPMQVGDERVLVTKPPKYRGGPVSPEERLAFFSDVMQHEFFHHLYWIYPEFKLEERSHQWFDRASWPGDFEGVNEADYYAESIHKRLLPQGNPPLWAKLRYAVPADVAGKVTAAAMLGAYRRDPVTNGWHEGSIARVDGALRWTNHAGKSWQVELSGDKRLLLTGPDNPLLPVEGRQGVCYHLAPTAPSGEFLSEVMAGFWFNGEFYAEASGCAIATAVRAAVWELAASIGACGIVGACGAARAPAASTAPCGAAGGGGIPGGAAAGIGGMVGIPGVGGKPGGGGTPTGL